MSKNVKSTNLNPIAEEIINYINHSPGLFSPPGSLEKITICQKTDGKSLTFSLRDVEEVIPRRDTDGNPFLQINFHTGKKILLTDNLVGFKPAISPHLDMRKLPSVVTTPDLMSVVDAIEESLCTSTTQIEEIDILRRVFGSVLEGGEAVGFDLTSERVWLTRLSQTAHKHSS